MNEQKSKCGQVCILATSFILLICGFALCTTGLVSPSWQVVDIREFRAEHHVRENKTYAKFQISAWVMAGLHTSGKADSICCKTV